MLADHRRVARCFLVAAPLTLSWGTAPAAGAQQNSASETTVATWNPPETDSAAELIAFIEGLIDREPTGESEQELIEHERNVARGIAAAAGRGLQLPPDPARAPQLYSYRLQALSILRRMGEPKAKEKFEAALAAAAESQVPDVQSIAVKFLVESRMEQWPTIADHDKRQMVDGVLAYLKRKPADGNDANTVSVVADFLSEQEEAGLANRLLKGAIPLLREQDSPELRELTPVLEGVLRRVNLPGKKVKLEGTLLDGSKLDWSQYKGKVVLIDFWASDCGPCREELPNVRKLYRAYHDKGFDVVGICIDPTKKDAMAAVRELQIPWATLFSHDDSQREWKDPLAVEFGVTAIPLAILLDQEHRVVHMNARGELLAEQLQKLLGKPIVQLNEPAHDSIRQVTAEEPDAPKQ